MLLVLNKRMEKSFKTQELKVTELDGKFQSLLEQLNSLKNVKIIKYKFDQMVYSRDAPLEKEVKTIVIKEIESVKMPEVKDQTSDFDNIKARLNQIEGRFADYVHISDVDQLRDDLEQIRKEIREIKNHANKNTQDIVTNSNEIESIKNDIKNM